MQRTAVVMGTARVGSDFCGTGRNGCLPTSLPAGSGARCLRRCLPTSLHAGSGARCLRRCLRSREALTGAPCHRSCGRRPLQVWVGLGLEGLGLGLAQRTPRLLGCPAWVQAAVAVTSGARLIGPRPLHTVWLGLPDCEVSHATPPYVCMPPSAPLPPTRSRTTRPPGVGHFKTVADLSGSVARLLPTLTPTQVRGWGWDWGTLSTGACMLRPANQRAVRVVVSV
jgi:hypothetical protein